MRVSQSSISQKNHNAAKLTRFPVHRDPEQPGEGDQAAAAHHVGHLPPEERRRHPQEDQDQDRISHHAAHLQAVAGREDLSVIKRVSTDRGEH